MKEYNKLIRNSIPKIIRENGKELRIKTYYKKMFI